MNGASFQREMMTLIVSSIIVGVVIILSIFRKKITRRFKLPRFFFIYWRNVFSFKFNKRIFIYSIIIICAALGLDYLLITYLSAPYSVSATLFTNPVLYAVTDGFLLPLAEEFIFRGVILGTLLLVYKPKKLKFNVLYVLIVILLESGLFSLINYFDFGLLNFDLFKFTRGLFYSLLYLASKRNLVPSCIAHMTNNLLLIILWI